MKRIILCADGTWNIRDHVDETTGKRRPTNVTKVARAVVPQDESGVQQIVYYHDGVGTAGGLDRFTGGAFGDGIEDNVRELYRFLLYNYQPGDEVYFFGFSRGAFTVRTLAGFMNKFGLLQKGDDYYVPDLFECYEGSAMEGSPEWLKAFHNVRSPRPCPPIKFIGVWDTVGALGAPGFLGQLFNRKKYQFHDVALNPHIENAYQALAIDERRKPFLPNVWSRPDSWKGQLEQAWFAGVHSNVGGGYAPDGLANEALHWIVEKAEQLGLAVDPDYLSYFRPCFDSKLFNSMTPAYRMFGEYERPIGVQPDSAERVHRSAIDRLQLASCGYEPQNLKVYMSNGNSPTAVQTTRVATGVACGAAPENINNR